MSNEAPYAIYRAIEEQFATYGERQLSKLIKDSNLETYELHEQRAKVRTTEELLNMLRATLGYDHRSL